MSEHLSQNNAGNSEKRARQRRNLKPFKKGQSGNPGGRPRGVAAQIREATDDGALMVGQIVRVACGCPILLYDEKGETVKKWLYPSLRDIMYANAWLMDHYSGKPGRAEPPPQDDKPGLTIIFTHPRDYDPIALGKGQPTRIVDATVRELAPAPAERGTHEVLSGDDL